MSDAAVVSIVTGVVTIATMVVGILTLWLKVKYGVEQSEVASKAAVVASKAAVHVSSTLATKAQVQVVENKLDTNTAVTRQVAESVNGGPGDKLDEILALLKQMRDTRR